MLYDNKHGYSLDIATIRYYKIYKLKKGNKDWKSKKVEDGAQGLLWHLLSLF